MGHLPDAFHDRSAAHYLQSEASGTRLRTTLALAARAVDFPIAMINILDSDTQYTISAVGVDAMPPRPRASTFCNLVVGHAQPLVVEDTEQPQYARIPEQSRAAVGTYIGVPLIGRESVVVGSLCVLDHHQRPVTADVVASLVGFGRIIDDQLDLIRRLNEQRGRVKGSTDELAQAVQAGRIVPWYQPVVDLGSGATIGYEALARWVDTTGRVLPPSEFIPLGEDSDLIVELDRSILRQAIVDLARWQGDVPAARLMINVSGRNFEHDGWIADLHAFAAAEGVASSSMSLELTETAQVGSSTRSDELVRQLREHGFGLLLDDFGTGWSSLEYLLRLPVTGVKIDRVVAAGLGSRVGNALIRAVTGVAGELGISTTIEGIETAEQADIALALGCDFGQGFHWSRPVAAAVIDSAPAGSVLRLGATAPAVV